MILGLHHVTATVNDAQDDLDFYTGLLGQRLVKKTVNFDNTGVYHFYYGNEVGTPGTIMTTFPYKGMGVRQGVHGAGQINVTSFSVPATAMDFWRARLRDANVNVVDESTPFGEESLAMLDPSGLRIRIVAADGDARTPWTRAGISEEHAIRGIHSVALHVHDRAVSNAFLVAMMDCSVVAENETTTRLAIGDARAGRIVEVVHAPNAASAVNGIGTVHHVAFAVASGEEQLAMRAALTEAGAHVTEVRDRQYFTSIYFREPNGILFEIATLPPGFAVDETVANLGRDLKLPPWEETKRSTIEMRLPRVVY